MFFAYLIETDGFGTGPYTAEYQCKIALGVKASQSIGSRTQLTVSPTLEPSGYTLQVPVKPHEKSVECIEGRKCVLSCIYGGRLALLQSHPKIREEKRFSIYFFLFTRNTGNDPPSPFWRQPGETPSTALDFSPTSVSFDAIADAEGKWECNIDEPDTPRGYVDVSKKLTLRSHLAGMRSHSCVSLYFWSTSVHNCEHKACQAVELVSIR